MILFPPVRDLVERPRQRQAVDAAAVELDRRIDKELLQEQTAQNMPYGEPIRLGRVVHIVRRDHAAGAGHVVDDDRRITRDMLTHMARNHARIEIVAAARRVIGDGQALVGVGIEERERSGREARRLGAVCEIRSDEPDDLVQILKVMASRIRHVRDMAVPFTFARPVNLLPKLDDERVNFGLQRVHAPCLRGRGTKASLEETRASRRVFMTVRSQMWRYNNRASLQRQFAVRSVVCWRENFWRSGAGNC